MLTITINVKKIIKIVGHKYRVEDINWLQVLDEQTSWNIPLVIAIDKIINIVKTMICLRILKMAKVIKEALSGLIFIISMRR
jgi:hypothetical protein